MAQNGNAAALGIIRKFEGFRSTPYWDVNALRAGYGSDTITLPDGSVQRVGKGTRVSREDADRDLLRRVSNEFLPAARNAVGADVFDRLSPEQQGVLTSLTYNYGAGAWNGALRGVANAVRSGSQGEVAAAISALGSHNEGINRKRRNQEAAIFSGGSFDFSGDYLGGDGDYSVAGGEGGDTMRPMYSPAAQRSMYEAYLDGTMTPAELSAYRDAIMSGTVSIPSDMPVQKKYQPDTEQRMFDAFNAGEMTPEEVQAYEFGVKMGEIGQPKEWDPLVPRVMDGVPDTPKGGEGLDLTAQYAMEAGGDLAKRAVTEGVVDLPSDLGPLERPLEAAGNLGAAVIGGMGGLMGGAAGLAGDVAQGLGFRGGERLARDLAAMPEAFAGSPGALATPRSVAVQSGMPTKATPVAAPRIEPTIARPAVAAQQAAEPVTMAADEVGTLVRRAASGGRGSRKAAQKLAAEARVNPEALAAAERLGIDLPMDVVSDHTQIKEAVGLTRSLAGSEASADWRNTITRAVERADAIMDGIDASPDVSSISDRVYRSLDGTRRSLDAQASKIYDAVDAAIPKSTQAAPNSIVKVLNQEITDLGGIEGLSPETARLFRMVTGENGVTYGRLMSEKDAIGRAIARGDGPYGNANTSLLKRLYGAIAEDQISTVALVGGDDMRNSLEVANGLYAKKKALEANIVESFGKDLNGSIASKLRLAISQAGKGDTGNLARILEVVPEDLRGEAIATAISAASRSTRGIEQGGFGFSEFAKLYRGLRANGQSYKMIEDAIGKDRSKVLRDLYEVSTRITESRAQVLTTGKANQALVQAMTAEGIVAKVLNRTVPGRALKLSARAAANQINPLGGAVSDILVSPKSRDKAIVAAGDLFRSPEFQSLVKEVATTGGADARAIKRATKSKAFMAWAKASGIEDPQNWIAAAVANAQDETE